MVVRRRRKYRKKLGERTYHGDTKNRRGKGLKGGKGAAGAKDHKFIMFLKAEYKKKKKIKVINVGDLEKFEGKEIDLKKLGYSKLLARGNISKAVTVIVPAASKKSVEKIEAAGGKVVADVVEGS